MMLERVRSRVRSCLNVNKKFIFHGTRNQNEEFEGIVTEMYPAVFVIKIGSSQVRTFSYSDLLIGNLEILD